MESLVNAENPTDQPGWSERDLPGIYRLWALLRPRARAPDTTPWWPAWLISMARAPCLSCVVAKGCWRGVARSLPKDHPPRVGWSSRCSPRHGAPARFGNRFQCRVFDLASADWRKPGQLFHAVVSSLAIHHLAGPQKQALFRTSTGCWWMAAHLSSLISSSNPAKRAAPCGRDLG